MYKSNGILLLVSYLCMNIWLLRETADNVLSSRRVIFKRKNPGYLNNFRYLFY